MTTRSTRLTLKGIYGTKRFDEKGLRQPEWLKDSRRLSYLDHWPGTKATTVWLYDSATQERRPLFDPRTLREKGDKKPLPVHGCRWSPCERYLLLTETAPARFKPFGNLFLYDLEAGAFRRLTRTEEPQRNAKFSPDGRLIGLVRGDDLWTVDVTTGEERRLTCDAAPTVYNGRSGWVYEEELGLVDGWEWSPDGAQIAFLQQDESAVPEVLLPQYDQLHGDPRVTRYPKAGDPNPRVRVGVVTLATAEVRWLDLPGDPDEEFYVPRLQWAPGGEGLLVQRVPRLQNRLDLYLLEAGSFAPRRVLTEEDAAWVDAPIDARFVGESDRFVWASERDGWRHLYLYDLGGRCIRQLTCGPWEVGDVACVDAEGGTVTFTAARPDPTQRTLYRVSLDGGEPEAVLPEGGWQRAQFARDGCLFVHTRSDLNTPPAVTLRGAGGEVLDTLVPDPMPGLATIDPATWERFTFRTSDGETLYGRMLKPRDFDPSRRYPVLMHTYGGPASQVVTDTWGGKGGLWYHLLTENGYLICMVDNRGTGGRGRDFKKQTYLRLGHWEVNDQIEGARYLAGLPYVDAKRIGIWGWSYGGYMASLCILRGADAFRAAVAVAPVTDWHLYDTIYTERYMRRPVDNADGYKESAPVQHAAKLKGRFLLVHGTMDDNVHFQNAARLASALQDARKPFDVMYYPGKHHGIEDRHLHLFTMVTKWLRRNL